MIQYPINCNSCVVLPIGAPLIETYSTETNMLAIFANDDSALKWFAETYFQLFTNNRREYSTYIDFWAPLPWKNCKFLKVYSIDFIEKSLFIDTIIRAINNNYYIFIALDHNKLINESPEGPHETLIYGYCVDEQMVFISDFFGGKYRSIKVSFEQLFRSYEYDYTKLVTNDSFNSVYFLQKNTYDYNINPQVYKSRIESYLNSRVIIEKGSIYRQYYYDNPEKHIFGIDLYDFLSDKLVEYLKTNENYSLDYRGFHMMYSHKLISSFSLSLLEKEGLILCEENIDEQIEYLINRTWQLRNIILKYNLTKKSSLLEHAISVLTEIKIKDYKYFQILYESIK